MAASSSTLPYYWQLASASTSERLDASHKLVSALQSSGSGKNGAGSKIIPEAKANGHLFDDGLAKGTLPDQVTDEEYEAAEATLTTSLDGEIGYALRRLMRGLASHRESARLGFSVALTELLAHERSFAARHAIVLVLAYSRSTAKVRGQEERDLLFARLFGLATLVRSGILTQRGRASLEDWKRAVDVLFALGRAKTWLRESAAAVVVSALEKWQDAADDVLPEWRNQAETWLADKVCSEKLATAETVAIFLRLRASSAASLKPSHRLPHFASQDLLAPANLNTLARVLCGQAAVSADGEGEEEHDDDNDLDAGAPLGSSSIRAHFVWNTILSMALTAKGKQASFQQIYQALIDDSLFAPNASHQKKAWGFQVFERALRVVDVERLPEIFTPNLMRSLINHLSAKERVLHRAAYKVASTMQDVVKDRTEVGNVIIAQLTGPLGTTRFDATTSTKTIEGILRKMRAEDVTQYTHAIMEQVCGDLEDSQRKLLLDQLLVVVRNGQIASSNACHEDILTFLAGHGFFYVKNIPKKSAHLHSVPKPAFSASVQAACRSRLISCVGDLYAASSSIGENKKQAEVSSSSPISTAFDILDRVSKDSAYFTAIATAEIDALKQAIDTSKRLSTLSSKKKEELEQTRIADFQSILLAAMLYVRCELIGASSSATERATELLDPLIDCAERLLLGKKQSPGEPDVGEILVHCLATLLEEPSALLRAVATQVFNTFSHLVTRGAIKQLVHLLGFDADSTEVSGSEDISEDGNNDEMSDTMSETSATSSPSEADEDEDSEVDEKFASEVRDALKAGGIADQDDNDEENLAEDNIDEEEDASSEASAPSDFDDDQMMLIDDKLADIFRQKFASRKEQDMAKKATVAFHIKVVDLLDNFVKQQGCSPLCVDVVLPLLTVALEKDPAMDQLKARAASLLQKTLGKGKQWPTDVTASDLFTPLEAVHKLATTGSAVGQQAQLVTVCNVYLTRAASHDALQGEIARVYKDTLDDFITRRASNLKPQFLIDAFTRFPMLGFFMRTQLLEAASGSQQNSQHSFRQLQALEMLRAALTGLVAGQGNTTSGAPSTAELAETLVPLLTQVRKVILARASQDTLRVKDILKVGLQFVRLTKKLAEKADDDTLVHQVWPTAEIDASITALGSTNVLPNAASLQILLRQMSAIVAPSSSTPASSKKRAADATSASPAKKAKGKSAAKKARRSDA